MQLEAGSCSWKLRRTEVCEASTDEEPAPHWALTASKEWGMCRSGVHSNGFFSGCHCRVEER